MYGPVSASYPGKYPFGAFAAFVVGLYIFAAIRFLHSKRMRSENGPTRGEDVTKQSSLRQIVGLGVFCAFLVGVCFWEIYRH